MPPRRRCGCTPRRRTSPGPSPPGWACPDAEEAPTSATGPGPARRPHLLAGGPPGTGALPRRVAALCGRAGRAVRDLSGCTVDRAVAGGPRRPSRPSGWGCRPGAGYQIVARRDRDPGVVPRPGPAAGVRRGAGAQRARLGAARRRGPASTRTSPFGLPAGSARRGRSVPGDRVAVRRPLGCAVWRTWAGRSAVPTGCVGSLQGIGPGALVMIPTTFGALMLAGIAAGLLQVEAPSTLPTRARPMEALAVALAAAVVAPIGEELFFRGFALSAWARDLPAARGAGPQRRLLRARPHREHHRDHVRARARPRRCSR